MCCSIGSARARVVAIVLLPAFLVFNVGCTTTTTALQTEVPPAEDSDYRLVGVVETSGAEVRFVEPGK